MLILVIINTILILSILGVLIYYVVNNKRRRKCKIDTDEVLESIVKNGNVMERANKIKGEKSKEKLKEKYNSGQKTPIENLDSDKKIEEVEIVKNTNYPYMKPPISSPSESAGTIGSFN